MEMPMRKIAIYMLILTIAMSAAGCGKAGSNTGKDETIPVRVMSVKLENMKKALEYVGNIKGQDEAVV